VISAKLFANAFNQTCDTFWASPYWTVFMQRFADIVKDSISRGVLSNEDMQLTDDVVIFKLMQDTTSAEAIEKLINLSISESDTDWDMHVTNKARVCNPKILSDDFFMRLSEVDEEFKEKLDYVKYRIESGYFVKIAK